jgi:hypothetical protein
MFFFRSEIVKAERLCKDERKVVIPRENLLDKKNVGKTIACSLWKCPYGIEAGER